MNNSISLAIVTVAAAAAMIIAISLVGINDVFASKKKYEKNQATSQANACGKGELPLDVYRQNINQDEETSAALSGFQGY